MSIRILEGIEGARQANDVAVVIDVLRAATVSAYLLNAGVESIIPVASSEEAFTYQANDKDVLLVGEDQGIKVSGFDMGNSPSEILHRNDLTGRRVIHRSSTGTQGLVHAKHANEIIFGSFVTVGAILDHLRKSQNREITLIPMYAIEDQLCAEYIRDVLAGSETRSIQSIKELASQDEWLQNAFLDTNSLDFPETDFHLCFEVDIFDFFPVINKGKIVKQLNTQ